MGNATLIRRHGSWVIISSFIVALCLTLLPLPSWATPYRPEWVALVLIYWCIALPYRVGIGTAWFLGLLLDTVRGTVLGLHGLGLVMVAFLAIRGYTYLRVYPLWQQALGIGLLMLLYQTLLAWIRGIMGDPTIDGRFWLSSLTTALLWPWIFVMLRDLRRRFHVT
ncbi:MAG: rod shape-determining protein MreD [Gammaproteobacteria bacterium]|nr:MAG: rod shape-determining protein MreD [Gammaproteobacteria bacterium]